jgi:methyl-accepting chemotaxis protein
MSKNLFRLLLAGLLITSVCFIGACGSEEPAQPPETATEAMPAAEGEETGMFDTGEAEGLVEEAVEEMTETAEQATEAVEEAVEQAREATEDAAEEATEAVEEAAEEATETVEEAEENAETAIEGAFEQATETAQGALIGTVEEDN